MDVLDWVDVDPGVTFRARLSALGALAPRTGGAWRSLRHPLRAFRRRRLWAAQPDLFVEARRLAVGDAIERVRALAARGPVMVVPLDADDLESIEPFLSDGSAELAPGTLGWLVDRWASPVP